jgi:glycosyltransferase involved in cell wall biosynthesis
MQNIKKNLKILLIEPFYSGSHKSWADNYAQNSVHSISIISLKGIYWKWRMHGGAISLAKKFNNFIQDDKMPDIILTTDMLNLPVFTAFANVKSIPIVTFFHENQLTYPWSTQDRDKVKKRDHHYGFINYTTALKSDLIMYNSNFHKDSFINALQIFLKQFPDHNELSSINCIEKKSVVSHLGLTLQKFDNYKTIPNNKIPIILWNHRWEYDKNPTSFFHALKEIKKDGMEFQLVILGEEFDTEMDVFTQARKYFSNEILHMGYCTSFSEYAKWLWKSDYLPVTSNQEFFGASVMEAVYCDTIPILPNRLTYPELFHKKSNPHLFYEKDEELVSKLKSIIQNHENKNSNKLNKLASIFDWEIVAKRYDSLILSVLNNKK